MSRWYAIQIYPQFRNLAEEHLGRQGYSYFFGERISDNRSEPLFKGYGFVHLDLDRDRWTPINATRGVIHLLPRKSLLPLPLPLGFVEDLIERNPLSETRLSDIVESYFPGAVVEVTDGVMQGCRGAVAGLRGRRQLEVIFRVGSGSNLWIIDRDSVRPGVAILTESYAATVR